MNDDKLITDAEERAIQVILDAKLETDEDYIALAQLIDDEVSQELPLAE
jgi:hypothetical protein